MATIEIEVNCLDCGATLDVKVIGNTSFDVRPCDSCMAFERESGRAEGG